MGQSKELENLLIYPQMCILVLELLIPVQKNPAYDQVVIGLLQKILVMAKENKQNCGALYGQVSTPFLNSFAPAPGSNRAMATCKKSQIIQIASIYVYKLVLESRDQCCHRLIFFCN
jgi:hypothetical protein